LKIPNKNKVIHTRLSTATLAFATLPQVEDPVSTDKKPKQKKWPFPYVVPHRMQPISDPIDLPSLNKLKDGGGGVPRWVHDDISRVNNAVRVHFPASMPPVGPSSFSYVGSKGGSCCLDRGECKTRNHWLKFKVCWVWYNSTNSFMLMLMLLLVIHVIFCLENAYLNVSVPLTKLSLVHISQGAFGGVGTGGD